MKEILTVLMRLNNHSIIDSLGWLLIDFLFLTNKNLLAFGVFTFETKKMSLTLILQAEPRGSLQITAREWGE